MAGISIAGILRAGMFSPNHVGNDAAILNAVAALLRRRGLTVNLYSEEQFIAHGLQGDERIVMNMCRDERSIARLHALEDSGHTVINSGYAIANCARCRAVGLLERAGIPQPPTLVVPTNENARERIEALAGGRCWVKRADAQTIHKEDVTPARNAAEAQELLSEFFIRGIRTAAVSAHVGGEELKFYGVRGTDFFHHYFVHSSVESFDPADFRQTCRKAADALGVDVYGGDAIVDPATGRFVIISVNDWPSYAVCRDDAARGIARLIAARARKLLKR